jgi:DNA invertase Pin-like site-specific DNA recombinase
MNNTATAFRMPFGINLDRNRDRRMVFYGRVSTEHEAQLSALENQVQWYDDQAKYHKNWTVLQKYLDKGITGTQAKKRPAFLQMLEDARAGKFDLIVTREVCRFARNTVDTLVTTRELKNLGIEVYFVEDNIWTMDGDGELRLTLMATLAQEESRKVSERVKAGQKISRDNGILYGTGNIIGYDRVDGKYVINPEQAETVRIIFDLYLKGSGEKKLVSELTQLKRKDGYGNVSWSCSKIGRILKNSTYKGYQAYLKSFSNNYLEQKRVKNHDESSYIYVKGDYEPIISEEDWDKCEEIRKARTITVMKNGRPQNFGKPNPKDAWTPKMRCACGATFHRCKWRANKRGDEAFGYQCYSQINKGSKALREKNGLPTEGYCDIKMVGDWKLELMAKTVLAKLWTNRREDVQTAFKMVCDYAKSDTAETKVGDVMLDRKIMQLKAKIEGFMNMRAEGELSKEEYADMKAKADSEMRELLELQIDSLMGATDKPSLPDLNAVKAALDTFIDFSKSEISREIVGKFISKVTPMGNNTFQWDINFSGNEVQQIYTRVDGRKNHATVSVAEEGADALPFTYWLRKNRGKNPNTNSSGVPPRRRYAVCRTTLELPENPVLMRIFSVSKCNILCMGGDGSPLLVVGLMRTFFSSSSKSLERRQEDGT